MHGRHAQPATLLSESTGRPRQDAIDDVLAENEVLSMAMLNCLTEELVHARQIKWVRPR